MRGPQREFGQQGLNGRPITVIRAGEGGGYASRFEAEGIVAIGFGLRKDISGMSREQIRDELQRVRPDQPAGQRTQNAGQLYRFLHDLHPGDVVVMPESGSREFIIGEVTSPYEYWSQGAIDGNYWHVRHIKW